MRLSGGLSGRIGWNDRRWRRRRRVNQGSLRQSRPIVVGGSPMILAGARHRARRCRDPASRNTAAIGAFGQKKKLE
jgi:hypothetical protein